jgi:D-hydroxyproline dehydrogenase subunit beta
VRGVATDVGVIATERVVVAAGPRSRFLLRTAGVDLPIASTRGWLLETTRIENPPPYSIEQAVWPTQAEMGPLSRDRTLGELAAAGPDEPGLVSVLLGVHGAGQLRIGTSLSRSLREEPEDVDTPRRLAERAVRVAPHLADVPVVAAWSGRRSMTPDGLPVVGRVPGVEGLDVTAGFSSIGMITIPAACMRLAGEPDPAFDPGRFA